MSLSLNIATALNLSLEGSVGSFSVGRRDSERRTVEVKYFLTHISLNFGVGGNEDVLRHMAPVREIFPAADLEFDEIMQRDIDDSRVSSELVPYLLDPKSRDLVKLFPPIIVVVLPVRAEENRPADLYPTVTHYDTDVLGTGHALHVTRSGEVGQEVFQFEQPILHGKILEHDLTRLKLNTNKCRLVIVDGQHRAMALLAIYRNLKQEWSDDRRAPFKDFYEEWTPAYIRKFALDRISLPVMFCTFPELDSRYAGSYNIKMAARSIFLTLNKTARRVSDSRNRLLDDNDVVALFLRDTLSRIKQKDTRSAASLRISNVELDQAENRMKIESPIAITGVNHAYYIIEHLLLNRGDEDVNGARPRSGKFYKRTDLEFYSAFGRLDGRNLLGAEIADATSRDFYSIETGAILAKSFFDRFGRYIVDIFELVDVYECHANAVLWLEQQVLTFANSKIRPILFEGQGMGRVFAAHRDNLRSKLKSGEFGDEATKIQEIDARLKATQDQVDNLVAQLRYQRAVRFCDLNSDKAQLRDESGKLHPKVVEFVNDLYDNVFSTVAFQAALVDGFFGELERANRRKELAGDQPISVESVFSNFVTAVNEFFVPRRLTDFRKLVSVFVGTLEGAVTDWKITPSPATFRRVVYRGEMQPDQWPKYKYLLLEVWRGEGTLIGDSLTGERNKCRLQILNSLEEDEQKEFKQRNLKRDDTLTAEDQKTIEEAAYGAFKSYLRNVGWKVNEIPSRKAIREGGGQKDEDAESLQVPEETWSSEVISAPESEPFA